MHGVGVRQSRSLDAAAQESTPMQQESPHHQPVDNDAHQGRQLMSSDDLQSRVVSSKGAGPNAEASTEAFQPSEDPVGRGEGWEGAGPDPQQEISLRDMAVGGEDSPPEIAVGEAGHSSSQSSGMAEQPDNEAPPPTQLLLNLQQEQGQQLQQLPRQLRQQQSGNPFQAAANASSSPSTHAGDIPLPSRPTRIALIPDRAQASPDNPPAVSAAADDLSQKAWDANTSDRSLGPGESAGNRQPGIMAVPQQQSGTVGAPEWLQEPRAQVQAQQGASEGGLHIPGAEGRGEHGGTPTPGADSSSMQTAMSIAQLLADLPPAGV